MLLVALPRRWAALPLIVGACYMTRAQTIELGVASLTVVRLLIIAGAARLVLRREWIAGGLNRLDGLMILWGSWMVVSVVFHSQPDSPFVLRVRDLYEAWGLYFLFRVFCRTREDVQQMSRIVALALAPIAAAMVFEKLTGANVFAQFGGVPAFSAVRNGVVRAQGPFSHSILAGSIGGVCLPLVIGLWPERRNVATLGIAACLSMVLASGSSGPLLAVGAGVGVLVLWPIRERMRLVRWLAFACYLGLELVMNRPAVFIIADVDLMGGSTSWYRAELIRSSFAHLNEWWLVGTDYTRHWMPSGVPSSPTQTDITNHYIAMGVVGGLLLMCLFIAILVKGFWFIGEAIRLDTTDHGRFASWAVGASLFAHAATCLSVSYYDHSVMFLYLTLAAAPATLAMNPIEAAVVSTASIAPRRVRPNLEIGHGSIPSESKETLSRTGKAFLPKPRA